MLISNHTEILALKKRKIRGTLNRIDLVRLHLDKLKCELEDHDYQSCNVCKTIEIRPTELGRCTSTANYIAQKHRGKVVGYGAGPHGFIGDLGGGHDFALLYGRFLVDWWARDYKDKSDLYDIEVDLQRILPLYGDPSTWNVSADYKDRSVENIWQTDFHL